MSRLANPRRGGPKGGVKPEDASADRVMQYLNNVIWQAGYVAKAFEADDQVDLARLGFEAVEKLKQLKETWISR